MAMHTIHHLAAGVLAAAFLLTGPAVLAEPAATVTNISISTQNIDLASPASVQKLQRNVASAIRNACAPTEFGGAPTYAAREQAKAQQDCLSNAHAAAASQIKALVAAGNPRMAMN